MPQQAVIRPIGELDFAHQVRLQPVHAPGGAGRARQVDKRGCVPAQLKKLAMQIGQSLLVETGSHAPRIVELAACVVIADQNRAEMPPLAPRRRVASNHELFPLDALGLQPVAAAASTIRAIAPLRDDPLEVQAAGLGEYFRTGALQVVAEPQPALGSRQDGLQNRLPLDERAARQVDSVQVQQVESVVNQVLRSPGLKYVLQSLKSRHAIRLDRHHFAVEQRRLDRQRRGAVGQFGKFFGPIVPVAADEACSPAVNPAEHPVAVELDLVQPFGPCGRLLDERGQLDLGLGRQFAAAGRTGLHQATQQGSSRWSGPRFGFLALVAAAADGFRRRRIAAARLPPLGRVAVRRVRAAGFPSPLGPGRNLVQIAPR